jgi:hypothetical protein
MIFVSVSDRKQAVGKWEISGFADGTKLGIWGGSLRPAERDYAKAFGRVEENLYFF